MSKLVLIDSNAILHRAYHALPKTLTTKSGEPINAVYGFVSILLRIIQDLKPTHIACTFDRKEPTFRHKKFKAYQAQRPKMDEELSSQFEKAKAVIEAFQIPIYEMAGYEADDLIGTIANQSVRVKEEYRSKSKKIPALPFSRSSTLIDEVIVVTGDRDILQLVNSKVKVYLPIKGLSEAKLFGIEDVVEKMGVKPSQITDYKALVGDPSDNYPGVSGIGPKTAEKLLSRFGTLDNIYKHLDKLDKSTCDKLEKYKEDADISYKLAKIVIDVDVDVNLQEMSNWQVDNDKVLDLFSQFGFKTLTKRVKDVGKAIVSENQLNLL
ncbi:hypothetical protein A2892_03680 [Candidatus Woesebacteria bacterium RIFCSPLOWO2_01_FULL_39_10b]|uniref:5'-3' exonuclease domain-containing protein n=1 Tax=Candidatus Woesebacteria bacterium RIFCSPLOWO2_01_FULL_39_10b TaxID=1802517 RepID=A0A1F8B7F1_9BACT|nr:MAG: hypothetical protein A2892_03680 [Candidatus Woesebacteria bacterium RIFCSPLOWO2_01_FULL_39_10b]